MYCARNTLGSITSACTASTQQKACRSGKARRPSALAYPTRNAYIESFNGTFRDECLDESCFESLEQARQIIATWRIDYNETRPHSSCGRIPPATFALNRQLTGDLKHEGKTNAGIS